MKTSSLVSIVAAAHCLVVGAVLCIQGCGTTVPPVSGPPPAPPMPGASVRPTPPPQRPAVPVAQPPIQSWPAQTTSYTVQKGDSLSVIAKRFDVSMAEILALNHMVDADKLFAGRQLLLPGKIDVGAPPPPPPARSRPAPAIADGDVYQVQPGDVLSRIAVRHGTTVAALRELNGLQSDKIFAGQRLSLPAGSKPVTSAAPVPRPAAPQAPTMPLPDPVPSAAVKTAPVVSAPGAISTFREHTVEEGEDLYHVSLMWDVSVDDLKRVNSLTGTTLTPGQVLKIPMPE